MSNRDAPPPGPPPYPPGQAPPGPYPPYPGPDPYAAPPGYPQPGHPQPGYPQQGYPPQGYPQQGYPPGQPPPGYDARVMMMYDANKKSLLVAYLLLIFLGGFGAHRFYLRQTGTAVAQLLLSIVGWLLVAAAGLGLLLLVPVWIWLFVDLFLVPDLTRRQNAMLAAHLGGR